MLYVLPACSVTPSVLLSPPPSGLCICPDLSVHLSAGLHLKLWMNYFHEVFAWERSILEQGTVDYILFMAVYRISLDKGETISCNAMSQWMDKMKTMQFILPHSVLDYMTCKSRDMLMHEI